MDSSAQITVDTTPTTITCAQKQQQGSSPATSQTDTECSAPTSSTFDEERSQAQSVDVDLATPPTTPDQIDIAAEDGRQPPSPLAAAADKFPLVPYLSARPDDDGKEEGGEGGGEAKSKVAPVDGILVVDSQDCPTHHRRRRRRRPRPNVTFTTLTVHHHPHTLSDNPAVSDGGVPLGLAWTSTHTHIHDVDDYEYDRQMAGNERRSVQQLRMNGDKRRMLLLKVGHTDQEMEEMVEEVRRVQMNRARTMGGSGLLGVGGNVLYMGSKTKMVRCVGTKARRQVGKVVVAMDRATTIRIQPVGRAVLEFGQVDGCGDLAPADP